MRYRLLETLREYGAEQLTAQERAALAQRHLDYYQYRFTDEQYLPGVGGVTIQQRMDEVERELDNVRAALDWWVQSGAARDWLLQAEQCPRHLIELVSVFWIIRGYTPEGRRRVADVLALPGPAVLTVKRAYLLLFAGHLAYQQADFAAADTLLQESLGIYQGLPEKYLELWWCSRTLAHVARDQGDYARARSLHEQHLALARGAGSEREIATALYGLGHTAYLEGDLETARPLLEESLRILQAKREIAWALAHPTVTSANPDDYSTGSNHLETIAWARTHLGEVADARGDYASARVRLEESLVHFREFGRYSHTATVQHKLGRVAQHQGQWCAAATYFSESLAFWQPDGNQQGIAACLEGLAAVAGGQGDPERAGRLLGAAAALRERRRIPVPPVERADLDGVIAGGRAALGETAFAAAWAAGQAMPLDEVITEALGEAPAG
jgi:tetratricopeptide (TPR) repeat protein